MLAVMAFGSHHELVVVLGKLERGGHLAVCQGPTPVQVVEIVFPFLKKRTYGLPLRFANQGGIDVPTTDVGEAADVTHDLAKRIGPLPRHRERTDPG